MIGLGVGIDYALFILTRFREAYATPGPTFGDARESVVQAMDTAGRAVLFAGCTVVIALLGMMLLGVDFLYGVAISASIGVLLVMLASLTLLPALLTLAGRARRRGRTPRARPSARRRAGRRDRRRRGRVRRPAPARRAAGRTWLRWSAFVQRRPWPIAVVAALTMLLIAAPATALRLGSSDASNDPASQTTHRAYELLAQGFGEGFNGPLLVVAKVPNPKREAAENGVLLTEAPHAGKTAVETLRATIAATPGVVSVTPAKLNPAGDGRDDHRLPALLAAGVCHHPARLAPARTRRPADRQRAPGMTVYVGGVTAGAVDFATTLGHKLPLFIGVVVLLSRAAADDRLPLAGDPAAGRRHEPAQHRRVAGRDRGDLPVGLARRPVRRPAGPDRVVHPGDAVRDRVRAVDGLRGVPRLAHPRALDAHARKLARGRRGPGADRARGDGGGGDHGVRVPVVHARRRPHHQGVRPQPRQRRVPRRAGRALPAAAGHARHRRQDHLGAAGVAGSAAAAAEHRGHPTPGARPPHRTSAAPRRPARRRAGARAWRQRERRAESSPRGGRRSPSCSARPRSASTRPAPGQPAPRDGARRCWCSCRPASRSSPASAACPWGSCPPARAGTRPASCCSTSARAPASLPRPIPQPARRRCR